MWSTNYIYKANKNYIHSGNTCDNVDQMLPSKTYKNSIYSFLQIQKPVPLLEERIRNEICHYVPERIYG